MEVKGEICTICGENALRYRIIVGEQRQIICSKCQKHPRAVLNLFPMTTMHISSDPRPIEVQSLRHLRQLESQHGVQSVAFNQDASKWNDPPRQVERQRPSFLRR